MLNRPSDEKRFQNCRTPTSDQMVWSCIQLSSSEAPDCTSCGKLADIRFVVVIIVVVDVVFVVDDDVTISTVNVVLDVVVFYALTYNSHFQSYQPSVLVDLIARILALIPPWTRVYRVQRDIPMPLVSQICLPLNRTLFIYRYHQESNMEIYENTPWPEWNNWVWHAEMWGHEKLEFRCVSKFSIIHIVDSSVQFCSAFRIPRCLEFRISIGNHFWLIFINFRLNYHFGNVSLKNISSTVPRSAF